MFDKKKRKPKKTSSNTGRKRSTNSSLNSKRKSTNKKGKQKKQNSSPAHRRRELRNVTIDTYDVDKSHLSKGTKTTPKTRKHVNDPKTKRPIVIEGHSKAGKESHSVRVNNPSSSKYDAGHILAKQNGGRGDLPSQVMPQNPDVNRGRKGQGDWREFEDKTNKALKKEKKGKVTIKRNFRLWPF